MFNFAFKPTVVYNGKGSNTPQLGKMYEDAERNIVYQAVQASGDFTPSDCSGYVVEIDPTDWSARLIDSTTPAAEYNSPVGVIPTDPRPKTLGGSDNPTVGAIENEDIFLVAVYGNMPIRTAGSTVGAHTALKATTTAGQLGTTGTDISNIALTEAGGANAGNTPGFVNYPKVTA